MQNIKVGLIGTSQLSFPGPKAAVFSRSVKGLQKLSRELNFELALASIVDEFEFSDVAVQLHDAQDSS